MRDSGEELVLQAAGLLGLLPRALLAFEQALALGLGALAVGDVARDLRRADDRAARPADGRDGERDVYEAAVLAHALRLVVLDALAGPQAREDGWLFVRVVVGDEDGDWLADDLFGGVAEDALRALVPARDDAVQGLADDGVVRRLDDGGQPVRGQVGATQALGPLVGGAHGRLGQFVLHNRTQQSGSALVYFLGGCFG